MAANWRQRLLRGVDIKTEAGSSQVAVVVWFLMGWGGAGSAVPVFTMILMSNAQK